MRPPRGLKAACSLLLMLLAVGLPALTAADTPEAALIDAARTETSITGAMTVSGFEPFDIDAAEGLKSVMNAWIDQEYGAEVDSIRLIK